MKGNMTYRKARKLNAVFLLLLFATDHTEPNRGNTRDAKPSGYQGRGHSPEYFEEKLKEFERNKFRF